MCTKQKSSLLFMIAKISPTVLAAKSSKNTYARVEVWGFSVILVRKIARLSSSGRGHCIQLGQHTSARHPISSADQRNDRGFISRMEI